MIDYINVYNIEQTKVYIKDIQILRKEFRNDLLKEKRRDLNEFRCEVE